jgi:hypothetical protein
LSDLGALIQDPAVLPLFLAHANHSFSGKISSKQFVQFSLPPLLNKMFSSKHANKP